MTRYYARANARMVPRWDTHAAAPVWPALALLVRSLTDQAAWRAAA